MIEMESHIADVRIRLRAESLEHLFSEGMKSIYNVLVPKGKKRKNKIDQSIVLTGTDDTVLFINFLNEVLTFSLINKCVFTKISVFRNYGNGLLIDLNGYGVDSFIKDVKAVTFHEAEVVESESGKFETTIILDI
jgi:SHS2 domain-containing protein